MADERAGFHETEETRWDFSDKEILRRRRKRAAARLAAELAELRRPRIQLDKEEEPTLRKGGKVNLPLSDGSKLDIMTRDLGPKDGWPIFVCHGTPGSSLGPHPSSIELMVRSVRLIAWDRPGYGSSDQDPERIIADSATYVEGIAKAYDIQKASVAGRSGGGPSALACAALLPNLIVTTGIFSTLAPIDADINWHDNASNSNAAAYDPMQRSHSRLVDLFMTVTEESLTNPWAVLESIRPEMSESDRAYLDKHRDLEAVIAKSHADVWEHGFWGRVDDAIAAVTPWGFDPQEIESPVFLIQGSDDPWTPQQHFEWLVNNIPDSRTIGPLPEVGHIGTTEFMLPLYSGLKQTAREILSDA